MHLIFNLFFSLLHFLLCYIIFMTILLSNDVALLFMLLIIMIFIKYFYSIFGRCLLTLFEYNDYFPPTVELFSKVLSNELEHKKSEEILINIGLLIILNKLLILSIYSYYKKYRSII